LIIQPKEVEKMSLKPLVSIVVIFLNAEKYLAEAVESIYAQTYARWELLLVDDGSTDGSTGIARQYAARQPDKVFYLFHPGNINQGMSASRNLGIQQAQGQYIAFLDADDVWLPHKLEAQVAIMDAHPDAGMLYGETLYWYSWRQDIDDKFQDFRPALNVPLNRLIQPPELLPLFLRGKAAVPCPCSILVRSDVMAKTGGFVQAFNAIYEDQAFYAKICLQTPVMASDKCWDWYRQHPESSMAVARRTGAETVARQFFLDWLQAYLIEQDVKDMGVWQAVRREQWRIQDPAWLPPVRPIQSFARWVKKWALIVEENFLPIAVSYWLWPRKHNE
jgi:glycosyltransferase involved in cell wall biosynthesis